MSGQFENTTTHNTIVSAIQQSLSEGTTTSLNRILKLARGADFFAAVLDPKVYGQLFPSVQSLSFETWITGIERWLSGMYNPKLRPHPIEHVLLHDLWDQFRGDLAQSLRYARQGGIPRRGGVLAFVGGLAKCIVIRYEFPGSEPQFRPVAVINEPRSAFDVWTAIDHADQLARNELKSIMSSGHKLVFHRGVLVHVDRRKEAKVFGPSIDTLVMAELLARTDYEAMTSDMDADRRGPRNVMEIGVGSGLLSAGLVRYLPRLASFVGVDQEFEAVRCTNKNIEHAIAVPGALRAASRHLVTGDFDPALLQLQFDLVVCNPPYIPHAPGTEPHEATSGHNYFAAVAGVELLTKVLQTASKWLAPGGRLFLMTSSLCSTEFLAAVPAGFKVSRPMGDRGFEALFDVEAVFMKPKWLEHLRSDGAIFERAGAFHHRLHPVWISREGETR